MKEMIKVNDEDVRGDCYHSFRLPNNAESLTVRELIELRIETEVKRFNMQRPLCFYALVQPEGAEITSRGYRLKTHRDIDWKAQCEIAIDAFSNKSFLVSIAGKDFQSLDDVIETPDYVEISFVKFNEIVGG
ncbi:MAG: hypothetical protein OEX07_10280 [Gammaproteobacteria bacterium]|nr:hypothetical protein [Gammaproteobacteria bacterium]